MLRAEHPTEMSFDHDTHILYVTYVDDIVEFVGGMFDPDAPVVHMRSLYQIEEGQTFNVIGITSHSFTNTLSGLVPHPQAFVPMRRGKRPRHLMGGDMSVRELKPWLFGEEKMIPQFASLRRPQLFPETSRSAAMQHDYHFDYII